MYASGEFVHFADEWPRVWPSKAQQTFTYFALLNNYGFNGVAQMDCCQHLLAVNGRLQEGLKRES